LAGGVTRGVPFDASWQGDFLPFLNVLMDKELGKHAKIGLPLARWQCGKVGKVTRSAVAFNFHAASGRRRAIYRESGMPISGVFPLDGYWYTRPEELTERKQQIVPARYDTPAPAC
jgi:hypothetical protein